MNGLLIRAARQADLQRLVEIHNTMLGELVRIAPEGFGQKMRAAQGSAALRVEYEQALDDADSLLLVAEAQGEIAGLALGVVERFGDDLVDAPYLTVQYLAATEGHRGKGVGRMLLAEMERWACERELSVVELSVWPNNEAALGLYRRMGYRELERRMAKRVGDG